MKATLWSEQRRTLDYIKYARDFIEKDLYGEEETSEEETEEESTEE